MNFSEYQARARETAIYPEKYKVIYPCLGLFGECSEVCELIKKWIRDEDCVMSPERLEKIKSEISDVYWYIAALCTDLGLDMNEIAEFNIKKLQSRKERGVLKGDGSNR